MDNQSKYFNVKLVHCLFGFHLLLALNCNKIIAQTFGDFTYVVTNNEIKLTSYEASSDEVLIPSQINGVPVKIIGSQLFKNASLTNIILPSTLSTIADSAFEGCTNLQSIYISPGVTHIGGNAFTRCEKLKTVTLPTGLTNVSWAMFSHCSALDNLILPSGLTKIDGFAFRNCVNLKTIILSQGLQQIGMNAFEGCSSLVTIELPASLNELQNNIFSGCAMLRYVYFLGNAPVRGSNIFLNSAPIIYFEAGATGWLPTFSGRPVLQKGTLRLFVNNDNIKGEVSSNPQAEYFNAGTQVSLTANPKNGFIFNNWSGDFSSSSPSINIVVNTNVVVTANYMQDIQDNDADGLSNYAEYITHNTNPNLKDSNSDGVEDGQAVLMGYDPKINFTNLISHPPTGLYTTNQIQNMAMGNLVLNKSTNGVFSLNYDIEQSTDLLTWTPYQALSLPLTGLPTNKAFVRIKLKNSQ